MPSSPGRSIRVLNFSNRTEAIKEFKRRTGAWPVLSRVLYVTRYVLMLAIVALALWYARQHPDTPGQSTLVFLVAAPIFIFLWTIIESLVWNYELRVRQLTSRGTFLTIKQFPAD